MKKCHKCKVEKELADFPVNRVKKDGRSETCLVCKREYNRLHYAANKKYYVDKAQIAKERTRRLFWELKSELSCKQCGQNHPAALHFHHTDPSVKDTEISDAIGRSWSMTKILEEMQKCEVLCANCHAILHWEEKHESDKCTGCTQPSES